MLYVWAFFNFVVGLWAIFSFLIGASDSLIVAEKWWRFAHVGIILIPPTIFHTIYHLCELKKSYLLKLFYFQAFAFIFLALFDTGLFISYLRPFDGYYYITAGPLYFVFFIIWGLIITYTHFKLYLKYKMVSGLKKNQIKYFFLGSFLGFLGGITNFFPVFNINIIPIGNFTIPLYCLIVTYAILKFRLLDISLAIARTTIFIAVYSVVLGVPFIIGFSWYEQLSRELGKNWWTVPLICSTILATAGPFLYIFIQKKAEDKLLREQRHYQATLRQASQGMGRIKDLKKLLGLIVHIVTRAVRIEHCEIFLYHEDSKNYILKASKGKKFAQKKPVFIESNSVLVKYIKKFKDPIIHEEIKQKAKDFNDVFLKSIEQVIYNLDAAMVVPSFIEDKLIAIVVLGKKRSGELYSQDDLAVFSILANQSALAIENAQFYDDMKKTHAQLFKAEKMATIGTMADGLSHQINNRLHALGFIASDILDTVKIKRNGKRISKELNAMLDDVEHGLTRIQDNVKQGGEIVGGLLKYTRKGEEGFEPVDLDDLIDAALEMAQFKIRVEEINLVRNFSIDTPKIHGNFTQLQEVFFNIIDNAYDAMMQRKKDLKEKDYKTVLKILAEKRGRKIEITIQDNGIGVKPEDHNKIFTPFFTTKATSKKGTGLGMYVIRQIIEENHGGKVSFTSEYMQGSETKILLPIATSNGKLT